MARVEPLSEAAGAALKGIMGPEARRVFAHRPAMGDAVGMYNEAVVNSQLPSRLHEIVRYRVAELNDCLR